MEGKLDGNRLTMKATEKGGTTEECTFRLKVAVDGNRLTGTTIRNAPIELTK